jgi:glycosyltransferase involved in cell wall biosynthesis
MLPTVNVLIPTYNYQNELIQAIESALSIEYPNLSVIVSDDNSPNSIDWVLEKYKDNSRVKIYRNKQNIGRVANYRKLLYELSDAEWLINLDGDDFFINRHFVSTCFNILQSIPSNDTIAFFMGCKSVYSNNILQQSKLFWLTVEKFKVLKGLDYVTKEFAVLNNFSHSAILYRRALAIQSDIYSFDSLNTDFHSFLNMAINNNIVLVNEPFVAWRKHTNNSSSGYNYDLKSSKEYAAMIDVAGRLRNAYGDDKARQFLKRIDIIFYRGQITGYFKQRNFVAVISSLFTDKSLIGLKSTVLFKELYTFFVRKVGIKQSHVI